MTAISAYRDLDSVFANDQDFSTIPLIAIAERREAVTQFSQELRLASSNESRFDWIAGLYYYRQGGDTESFAQFSTGAGALNGLELRAPVELDLSSYAVFADVGLQITERMSARLGVRYTTEDQDLDFTQDSTFPMFRFSRTDSRSDSDVSSAVSLTYEWSDDVTSYAKHARGFKSGGYNTTFVLNPAQITTFDPETLDSFELGLKTTLADRRLRLNSSVYYLEYVDKQESVFLPAAFSFSFENAAQISSMGAELEMDLVPNDWATLQLSVGWNDGEFDRFPNCAGLGRDCDGNDLTEPSLSLSAATEVEWPMSTWASVLLRVDARWQDRYFTNVQNTLRAEDRTLMNARLGLRHPEGRWEVAAWVTNLLDDDFFSPAPHPFFPNTLVSGIAPPRMYGVEARLRF